MVETTSLPTPLVGYPSSTVTNRLVFMTLLIIDSRSRGFIVLKLITSTLTPYFSISSAAFKASPTILEKATTVTSFPSRITFAFPIS